MPASPIPEDPLWYKDAIIYEVHVRAFCDSDNDGIGDFKGLASKLDYLVDLGANTLWILPFYPSPLKDDGYDISDYMGVHSSYGTLQDFKFFLKEAHRRGLRVITELVLNHTSDQHQWFRKARRAPPDSPERNMYVWNDGTDKYKDTRIIFKDFETSNWALDPVAKSYFWHRFYSHQPDLNYENPEVRKAMFEVVDFWMDLGVDGMRLDAVPYLFEQEGTNCENLPQTHQFLKDLRAHVDKKYKHRMLLSEANQWPEDAVNYFGNGDECHMSFHFPIMPRLFMSIHMEDRYPIIDILNQTPPIPENCQWAIFLRNHDELTLEMVTDEERDYMYRVYAHDPQAKINLGIRRRLAPLLLNHRRKVELMNGLLFSLPGTPVLYYGDEIGMGDNIYLGDRNGVRTPMQWSSDKNAGFSRSNPQKLYLPIVIDPEYHYETVNVEAQQNNPHSLLWWTKRLITLRKQFKAFSRGSIEFLAPENKNVLTFIRKLEDQTILVVANLSRFVQYLELDLSAYEGYFPIEMFGKIRFPRVGELPYFITLGPHSFYWFVLEQPKVLEVSNSAEPSTELKIITSKDSWEAWLKGKSRKVLEELLPHYISQKRWFRKKSQIIKSAKIINSFWFSTKTGGAYLCFVRLEYSHDEAETYLLPLALAHERRESEISHGHPHNALCKVRFEAGKHRGGTLYDAMSDKGFLHEILDAIQKQRTVKSDGGMLSFSHTKAYKLLRGDPNSILDPQPLKGEQSNTSVVFGERMVFKIFRRSEEGINSEVEIARYLTEKVNFQNSPPLAGVLELTQLRHEPSSLAILQAFVPSQEDAWQYTLNALGRYYETILTKEAAETPPTPPHKPSIQLTIEEVDPMAVELINPYLEIARLIGQRTADLHLAFSQEKEDPSFTPEPFSPLYQRSLYQSMRNLTFKTFQTLSYKSLSLSGRLGDLAQEVLGKQEEVLNRFQTMVGMKIASSRIRCHGDYHLGQLLHTGKDFYIIDFEGEPSRSLQDRRTKRSPLRDVASMMRSFHYAAHHALLERAADDSSHPDTISMLQPWARFWCQWTSSAFLRSYMTVLKEESFLPKDPRELEILLNIYQLEKAVYELSYELNNRPDWIEVPLLGILNSLSELA